MAIERTLDLSEHDKRVLSSVGHGPYGKELIAIIAKAKAQLSSLDGIERGGDYSAEVEGRLLFKDFAENLIRHLQYEKHLPTPESKRGKEDFS